MNYEILTKQQYGEFERFVSEHQNGSFMQSIHWAEVKQGWSLCVCVLREGGEIIGGFAALVRKVGPASFIYAPRGPVCDYSRGDVIAELCRGARELLLKYNGYEFIFDPPFSADRAEYIDAFKKAGCEFVPKAGFKDTIQPRYNYVVDTEHHTEESLMASFARETRYYIRYAEKKGIVCRIQAVSHIDDFYGIYEKTGSRQGFNIRPKEYLEGFLNAFPENARLYICYFEQEPLCGGIAVQYAGCTSHVYGASSDNHRNLRPTYLLQWKMMQWAIGGRSQIYDMQGVAIRREDSEALYNVLGFKQNFTGRICETAGEFKIVGNKLLRAAVKMIRG